MTELNTHSTDDLDHLLSSLESEGLELQPIPELGSARPCDVLRTYENGSRTPSPVPSKKLDQAPREDSSEDERWNLVPVPANEEARPRHFSGVRDPYGVELIPLNEPPKVEIIDPRYAPPSDSPREESARQRGSPGEEEPLKHFSPRDKEQCVRPRTYLQVVSSPLATDPSLSPPSDSPGDQKTRQRDCPGEQEALKPLSPDVVDGPRPRIPCDSPVKEEPDVFKRARPRTFTVDRDFEHEPPGIAAARKEEVENKLERALKEGDFDSIEEEVTVKSLTSCQTNALLKAFEVNKRLKDLADGGSPENKEFQTLANSVDEFTSALINPLKADVDARNTFRRCLDYVVDKAIDAEQKKVETLGYFLQKQLAIADVTVRPLALMLCAGDSHGWVYSLGALKFIAHPVVYNLLMWRWYGSFLSLEKSPWSKPGRWRFLLLNLWTLIDMIVFPILFAVFSIIHVIHERSRKRGGSEIGFVVSLSDDATNKTLTLVKNTMIYVIHKYGCQGAKYFDVGFDDETSLLNKEATMKKAKLTHPQLHKNLCQARDSFNKTSVRPGAKKILLVFVNDQIDTIGNGENELTAVSGEIKQLGVQLVPVGIGEHARLQELTEIASEGIAPLHFGDYELSRTLSKAILQGVEGKDIYEHYLDVFTTPYSIFVRDTLSSLALLGLHFAICLSPSTVAFSGLEWVIFVFFLGRVVMEVDQFVHAKLAERKATKNNTFRGGSYHKMYSPSDQNETPQEGNVVLRKFRKYFADRWNQLDFIILVTYFITFTLRMITWAISTGVYENRPLAVACYLYGLIAMFLTLRVFGQVMECVQGMGAIQIALFFIMRDVAAIFLQFLATILAFSLVMTKVFIAERSYTSNRNATEELACSNGSFDCWWSVAKHLGWSLLGVADLDSLNSIDGPSVTLARFLYSFFLIMGVILLVNMMIALLSNTYQRVEDNSLREWSFKKAITVRTYSECHPTPVPFNLISIPVVALYRLCCSKERPIIKAGLDECGRRFALDKLVVKLQRMYFEKYGYSFPLTDERKMDQLLHETEGNRQIANQIVRRVFKQRGSRQDKMKTGAYAWASLGIGIEGCLLTYQGPYLCNVCKGSGHQNKYHGARHLAPFTREMPRIEVLIQESGERRILAVGVVYNKYEYHEMPGWWEGTVGYHVDDGKIFEEGCDKLGREVKGAMAYRGDLVACQVEFDGVVKKRIPIVFFLNGREVARATMQYTAERKCLYPFISMGYEGVRVLAKMRPPGGNPAQPSSPTESDALRYQMEEIEDRYIRLEEKITEQQKMIAELKGLLVDLSRELKKDTSD